MDFMASSVKLRKVRTLNVIDEYNREVLGIEINYSLPSTSVISFLEELIIRINQKPVAIRLDNGTEFTSGIFTDWAKDNDIDLFYIEPGKPFQNCYIERFNGTYRAEVLNKYSFDSIAELKAITKDWLFYYNHQRPHSSLGGVPPKLFLEMSSAKAST